MDTFLPRVTGEGVEGLIQLAAFISCVQIIATWVPQQCRERHKGHNGCRMLQYSHNCKCTATVPCICILTLSFKRKRKNEKIIEFSFPVCLLQRGLQGCSLTPPCKK